MENKWKSVKIEGSFEDGDLDGLIGIEELTDYDINSILKPNKNVITIT